MICTSAVTEKKCRVAAYGHEERGFLEEQGEGNKMRYKHNQSFLWNKKLLCSQDTVLFWIFVHLACPSSQHYDAVHLVKKLSKT